MSGEERGKEARTVFCESIFSFLKMRRVPIIIFIGIVLIFGVLFYLYDIPQDAVIYGCQLSIVWGGIWLLMDFWKYYKRHRLLYINREQFFDNAEELPECMDSIERDYQELARELCQAKKELISQNRISRKEMLDYYGMWVHQIKTPIAAMDILLQNTEQILYQLDEEAIRSESNKNTDTPDDAETGEAGVNAPDDTETNISEVNDTANNLLEIIREAMPVSDMKMELFKIEQYVEMALTYLRVEDMSSDLSFKKYDLDGIIRQAIKKHSKIFISKKIKMNFQPTESKIVTDEKWFAFVLEQLISNALKYTREGAVSIYMEGKSLVIEDTGIGIPAEDLPRIFEKGFTGYNGRENKKSTGIGLYLCKNIMDKLQWNIKVTSKVGAGTKIYLTKM